MTSRERTLLAINHREPDRPPLYVSLTPQVAKALSEAFGVPYEPPVDALLSTRMSHMNLLAHMGVDIIGIAATYPASFPSTVLPDGRVRNEWGMVFRTVGLYGEFDEFPLQKAVTANDIEQYDFPDPLAPGRFDVAQDMMNRFFSSHGIVGDLETSVFETAWYLTGLEKFLMDLLMEAEYLPRLLDKIMSINTTLGKKLIELGVDILWCGDDFGSQQGMIMDPDLWRKVFKPRIREMFAAFRKVRPDIKLAWHSCGSILPIIPDLIELGLDILNPIQPLANGMDPEFLKNTYGKDLIFFGGIDVQRLLPYGTPQQISDEVKRRAAILGNGGGYIIAPAHNIQPDTPVANIVAFFDAVKSLG